MKGKHLVTTVQLARLFHYHPFRIVKVFPEAFVARAGRCQGRLGVKYWDLKIVADIISKRSGATIKVNQLSDLITPNEAAAILGRTRSTLYNWSIHGVGPQLFTLGLKCAYREREVIKYAAKLAKSETYQISWTPA